MPLDDQLYDLLAIPEGMFEYQAVYLREALKIPNSDLEGVCSRNEFIS
jgi:hypothetical protein